jgi:hypothetical protein
MRQTDLVPFFDRMGRLEGLIEAMHKSLESSTREATRYLERVDRLETRQLEIERRMVTSDQFQDLVHKFNRLLTDDAERRVAVEKINDLETRLGALETSDAVRKGGVSAIRFNLTNFISLAAVLIALGSVTLPSLINEPQPQQIAPPAPTKP